MGAPEPVAGLQQLRPRLEELAQQLRLDASARQLDALIAFLGLLHRWNNTYNLTAVRKPAEMFTQHLADCLAVLPPLIRELGDAPVRRILDVGSGAGLPGIVIAVMLPQVSVTCVDKVGKKAAFIRQVVAELGLPNLAVEHARVEDLRGPPFDLIVSRAFSSLHDLVALTQTNLAPRGRWLAMKGKSPADEIAALDTHIDAFHVEPLEVPGLGAERCLVWMRLRQSR